MVLSLLLPTATAAALIASAMGATAPFTSPSTHAPVFLPFGGPVHFDFYVLAQSWQPQFCHGKVNEYPGCKTPEQFWRSHFTMHGLWPELASGKHPGFCGGAPFDGDSLDRALGRAALVQYWPNVKIDAASPEYSEFWNHEWTRHGTCSGLDEVTYFRAAVDLLRNGTATTPVFVQQNVDKNVSAIALRASFGPEAAVLKCDHGAVLSQVFTCWEKDAQLQPTTRRACPSQILHEDTCTKTTVFIPTFP